MKTIKIIDLLNKITNGEELPKKIKYDNRIWTYDICNKDYNEMECGFYGLFTNYFSEAILECLNDEVEIIEEDKKIGKIERVNGSDLIDLQKNSSLAEQNKSISKLIMYLNKDIEKINELIDIVNDLKKEGKSE